MSTAAEDGYVTPIEQCSVEDKEALAAFRLKRLDWLSWLNTDEHHAIWKQITAMAWNDAVFRVLNEARTPVDDNPVSATNGMLGGFIDQGYVSTQVLAIRRLVEVPKPTGRRPADIISLPRLIGDIRSYRPHLTRELFVSYDGLPYEWEVVRDRYYARIAASGEIGGYWLPTTGADAFDTARRQHATFDWLSDTPAEQRSRNDLIAEWVFDRLDTALNDKKIKQIVTISHKFLAHAADETSRSAASLQKLGLLAAVGRGIRARPSLIAISQDKYTWPPSAVGSIGNYSDFHAQPRFYGHLPGVAFVCPQNSSFRSRSNSSASSPSQSPRPIRRRTSTPFLTKMVVGKVLIPNVPATR